MEQNQRQAESLFISGDAFETIARLRDVGKAVNMQGMAMRDGILYAFKVARDNSCQVLYRVELASGRTQLLRDKATGSEFTAYLTHANDACLFEKDGTLHMLVATMAEDETALTELLIEEDGYRLLRGYGLQLPGCGRIRTSAVEILKQSPEGLSLLLNDRNDCFFAELPLDTPPRELRVRPAFTLDVSCAPYKGEFRLLDVDEYCWQGIAVRGDKLIVPRTHGADSVFLVFDLRQDGTVLTPDPALSFCVTDRVFKKLEAEGCGFDEAGHLYFNSNRRNHRDEEHFDAVHRLRNYIAPF